MPCSKAFSGSPGLVVGFLLAGSIAALLEGRLVFAGGVLALSLINPQITALVALYLLLWSFASWQGRRRFARSFLLCCGLLVGSSLFALPIRTARSIPFAVLALLGLMMREVNRHNSRRKEQIAARKQAEVKLSL